MGLCSKVMGIFTRLAGTGVSQVCCVITPCRDLFQLRCQYWDHLTQQAFVFDLCLRGSAGSQYLWRTDVASVKNLTGFSVREAKNECNTTILLFWGVSQSLYLFRHFFFLSCADYPHSGVSGIEKPKQPGCVRPLLWTQPTARRDQCVAQPTETADGKLGWQRWTRKGKWLLITLWRLEAFCCFWTCACFT